VPRPTSHAFSIAFAFVIYFRLKQTLGSVSTTARACLRVRLGVALGVVFLGETLTSTARIGLGCVVIGVAAMAVPARKAAVSQAWTDAFPLTSPFVAGWVFRRNDSEIVKPDGQTIAGNTFAA
jgi:drug/metabolite transporter (DMT)-like permease